MENALQPTETHLEVANAASPMRVYLLAQARQLHCHPLRRGIEKRDRSDEIKPQRVRQQSGGENLRSSNAPDLLSKNNSSTRNLKAYCQSVCKLGGSSVITAQGSFAPFTVARTRVTTVDAIEPQADIVAVCRRGKLPPANHLVKPCFS